ncbi:MAG: histidine kinase dimerization/phospho-acceptor domain-containing protein [Verrucomicrobiaceae bacterium]
MSLPDSDPSLSSIAHDFKTPLTGIQMILHLLAEQKVGPLNETQASMITQAKADCDRLVDTIQKHFEPKDED